MLKRIGNYFLFTGALSILLMSVHYLLPERTGILRGKEIANFAWYRFAFLTHVLGGLTAITVGSIQFIQLKRNLGTLVHRLIGRIYVYSVLLSAIGGIVIAPYAMGAPTTSIGFSILSLLWIIATIKAIAFVKKSRIEEHRNWMTYSYALTFSAITQRTMLLIPLLTQVPFMPIYKFSAWLPWMINLGIAYWINLKRSTAYV